MDRSPETQKAHHPAYFRGGSATARIAGLRMGGFSDPIQPELQAIVEFAGEPGPGDNSGASERVQGPGPILGRPCFECDRRDRVLSHLVDIIHPLYPAATAMADLQKKLYLLPRYPRATALAVLLCSNLGFFYCRGEYIFRAGKFCE